MAEFGFHSTFRMAEAWLPTVLKYQPPAEGTAVPARGWRDYWDGISFALPLLSSALASVTLGFSLWGGELTSEEATAVGLGTVGSFLVSGGLVQAMARLGLFFFGSGQFRRCEQSTWLWVRVGAAGIFALNCVAVAASAYWTWLPLRLNLIASAFCVSLGLFWLATGILYILGRRLLILLVTLAGILLVAVLHYGFGLALLTAQLAAIATSTGGAFCAAACFFRRKRESSSSCLVAPWLLRNSIFLWPYFAYGFLYYVLLFGDRLMAWTAQTYASPLSVQFRGDYEAALNFGLIAFIFQVGWVHHSMVGFYREITRLMEAFRIDEVGPFRRAMLRFYRTKLAWFVALMLGASALAWASLHATGLLQQGFARSTALWSLAGFPLLVVGLWHVSLLFSLAGAAKAAAAAAAGCTFDIGVGYLCSRLGGYELAVVGFTCGAAVFALLSGIYTLRAFRRLDQCYFAASA